MYPAFDNYHTRQRSYDLDRGGIHNRLLEAANLQAKFIAASLAGVMLAPAGVALSLLKLLTRFEVPQPISFAVVAICLVIVALTPTWSLYILRGFLEKGAEQIRAENIR